MKKILFLFFLVVLAGCNQTEQPTENSSNTEAEDSTGKTAFMKSLEKVQVYLSLKDLLANETQIDTLVLASADDIPDTFRQPNDSPETYLLGQYVAKNFTIVSGVIYTPRGQELIYLEVFDISGKSLSQSLLVSGGGLEGGAAIKNEVEGDLITLIEYQDDLDTGDEEVLRMSKKQFDSKLGQFVDYLEQ